MSRILLALVACGTLLAQAPKPEVKIDKKPAASGFGIPDAPFQSDVARLLAEIAEHQQAYSNLEEMCDDIGPRLTGSERLRKAQAWAMDKLKGYGAVNVHEEPYEFAKAWTRGRDRARLLTANGQDLHIAQMAWTPGTVGLVKGEVAFLEAKTLDELKAAIPSLAGRIVLQVGSPKPSEEQRKEMMKFYQELQGILAGAHFKVLLRDANRKNDLLNMTGSPIAKWGASEIPTAFIASEHANLIKRLMARGKKPELEIELGGSFSKEAVKAFNVVAEIRGSEKPEEIVLVGGHQDSWDLGTGATDNGTGTVAAMEVLRAMQALGLKPRRTLRVVLFSGEEEGLLGSEAYVKAHEAELPKFQAVLVDDMGSGRIKGWPDMGQEMYRAPLAAAMVPANQIGATEIGAFTLPGATDHWPFHQQGVPAFAATQEELDYMSTTHHSQADTFDHVVKEDLTQGIQAMAATAWGLLNGERLPHHPAALRK